MARPSLQGKTMFFLLLFLGLACLANAMSSLTTGVICVKGSVVHRRRTPRLYWFLFWVFVWLGCWMLQLAYWELRLRP